VPMLASASGLVYLAFCDKTQRDALLDMLARSKNAVDQPARNRMQVHKLLLETRERGFSIHTRPRRVSDLTTFSVPIISDGRLMAALTVRFSSTALPQAAAIDRFVPRMRRAADEIGAEFSRQRAEYASHQPGGR
jgi:IclR family transcriptional regulator, mhp operon transcriptional activator